MKKRMLAMVLLSLLTLTACGGDCGVEQAEQVPTVTEPEAEEAEKPEDPMSEVLTQAEQAGLIEAEGDEALSENDAQSFVAESIDASQYVVQPDETAAETTEGYYVFDVADQDGNEVGKVAIDKENGTKYTYTADGALTDYSNFPLYDASVDAVCDWAGEFSSHIGSLEILQGDGNSFEYRFFDKTTGHAAISGNTAKDAGANINFVYVDGTITVVGGDVTGNYKRDSAE